MIQEAYVSQEVADLLKAKGFPQDPYICNTAYTSRGRMSNNAKSFMHNSFLAVPSRCYSIAPTQQMACEWLRQEHNLSVEVYRTACGWVGCVVAIPSGTDLKFLEDDGDDLPSGQYTTHAKACEATIKYCLENLIK